jgi:hypothetical protein
MESYEDHILQVDLMFDFLSLNWKFDWLHSLLSLWQKWASF